LAPGNLAGAALAGFRVNAGLALTHELIFDVVLPPLLFEAALNLRWKELRRDLVPVLALATVGVALCAGLVSWGLVHWLSWPMKSALAFGALIAATDPISVIALLRETRVTGRFRFLIEAESLFNDGAATVLFTLVLVWAAHDGADGAGALEAARILGETAGGGILVGLVVGAAAVIVAGTSDDHLVETALTVLAAFGSFLLADHFHGSGVLATVAAGVVMGNLGVLTAKSGFGLALSAQGRTFVLAFWEFAAFLANSLVFLLIGSAMASIEFSREGWQALAIAIGLALAGRAAAVYPICLAFSRSRWAVPQSEQHLLWWGGLRGALALALALSLPADLPGREDILIVAFAVVAFSVIVQGLTAPFALRWLGLAGGGGQSA
jgi:CPA1 family monovalent cation:H+ antiporter